MSQGVMSSLRNRGVFAWMLGLTLISFYVLLYWAPQIDKNFIFEAKLSDLNQAIEKAGPQSEEGKGLVEQKKLLIKSVRHPEYYKGPDYVDPKLDSQYINKVKEMRSGFTADGLVKWAYSLLNPLSEAMRNKPADRWFLYGFLYTLFVVGMGIRFIRKWRNSPYQKLRTFSVMFFQAIVAFMIPAILVYFNTKEFYFHYFWPLKMEYFYPQDLKSMPQVMAIWAIMMAFIAVPILTYFYGKRWYCSWVCGCGALAETAGDPFRHLSDKSSTAWRVEQITIHSVLVLAIIATALLFINEARGVKDEFGEFAFDMKKWYGFFIASGFAGVVGTGFYPLAGSRVWCRFGCPQAAILGLIQVLFSRFRITTNGDQCMSCGNCSTYCEMGIDVRQYAMTGKDIVRASCVGCGMCASVCPRGVLKLETGPRKAKMG